MKVYTLQFWLLCLSSFLFFTSFNMVLPELPDFMRSIGGEKYIGLHIAFFTMTAGLSRPFSGKMTDRWGPIPVMIIGSLVTAVIALFYPFVLNIYGFLALRFLNGFSTGFKPTGTAAYVADVVPAERRGEAMGMQSFFSMIGMGTGYFISSAIVSYWSINTLFFMSSGVALLSILILAGMKETLEPKGTFSTDFFKISWADVYEPSALRPSVVMLLNTFCFGVIVSLFPDFSVSLGIENKGLFFVYFVIASMASRIIGGRLSDRYGRVPIIQFSLLIVAVGCVMTGQSTIPSFYYLSGVVYGFGYGMVSPALFAWVVDMANDKSRGRALSTVFLALEIGIGSGALVSSLLYQGHEERLDWIFTGSAIFTIVGFIYLLISRPKTE